MIQENGKTIRKADEQAVVADLPAGQLWQVPVFFLGLLGFIATALSASGRQDGILAVFQAELTNLRRKVDSDQEQPALLTQQAETLLESLDRYPRQAAEIHFLVGSAYFRQANQLLAQLNKDSRPDQKNGQNQNSARKESLDISQNQAIAHLEEANAMGVPAEDNPALLYRLGFTLYQQGKEPIKAIELMTKSVEKGADRPADGYGLLVRANLTLAKPNLEAAFAANTKQLELTDDRNPEEKAHARLLRAQLLLRRDESAEASKELKRIGPTAPRNLRIEARLLQIRICEEQGNWNEDVELWKELLPDADAIQGGKVHVLYALGQAYKNAKPPRLDEAMARWNEAFALGGAEAAAAGIRLGELMLYSPRPDVDAVLRIWTKVLEDVRSPSDYKIPSLELSRAREIFEDACQYLKEGQDYLQTQRVAELYKKIAPAGAAEERLAQAAEGVARQLLEKAKLLSPAEAAGKMEEIRRQFQLAANEYRQAAEANPNTIKPDTYWRSAQCYLEAKDFTGAAQALHKFVEVEKNEIRLAEGWLSLAEAYLALGNKENARAAYYKCIEFPTTPFAFRARYRLALEEMDKKNYDQALSILSYNLDASSPVQDRDASENSMFKVAELYFIQEKFDQAALYFKKACEQYPLNDAVLTAREKLGDCYRHLANQETVKMQAAKDDGARAHYQNSRANWLKQSADVLETLADELATKARGHALAPFELGMLRNALFGTADMRFEMNDFSEALRRYEDLQDKYPRQVEGLIACQRIFKCSENMIEPPQLANKARKATETAVKKALADLEKMPEDSLYFRGGPNVWTKRQWLDYLHWIDGQLQPLPLPPASTPIAPPK